MKKLLTTFSGENVYSFQIENEHGIKLTALNYGAIITELLVPDRYGKLENIVLAYDDPSLYESNPYYLGAVIGRTSGRTEGGLLNVDDIPIQLEKNDGNHHLHGGNKGLSRSFWNVSTEDNEHESILHFDYFSPDGEDSYPGNVRFRVSYRLTNNNELKINYHAKSDQKTPINLTNHSYFNLSGNLKRDILEHTLQLASNEFYSVDEATLPVKVTSVAGTPFDFRVKKRLQDVVEEKHQQLSLVGNGIDHAFILDPFTKEKVKLVDEDSGRMLTMQTSKPSAVIYSGNKIEKNPSLNGTIPMKYAGICFEAQKAPNQTENILIDRNETYESQTIYSFSYN